MSNSRQSTFDKYNHFTINGQAPAYLSQLLFETLLTTSMDETASAYGLLVSAVEVAKDGKSATFMLYPLACLHNGDVVLAKDVKHSFDTLVGPHASAFYKPSWPMSAR